MKDLQILIDVRKLMNSETGRSNSETIIILSTKNDEIDFTSPLRINTKLTNINSDIYADIDITTSIKNECSKCLKPIDQKINLHYQDEFKLKPLEDEFKINPDNTINLWPSIRQEIIIREPLNVKCKKNCKGIAVK